MRKISEAEVRKRLAEAVENAGGQTALARKWGVAQTYIGKAMHGRQRIGQKLCSKMGVVREDNEPTYYVL